MKIVHFKVGNGNCCVVEASDFVMAVDLHGNGEESSFELVSSHFRKKDDKDCLDVLVVTHGDRDHCGGYKDFQDAMDKGELVIGKIIHQGYDRTNDEDDESCSDDYECLQKEINSREKVKDPTFGDLVGEPKAGDKVVEVMRGLTYPSDMLFDVLSPVDGDDEDSEYDVNDVSLVFRLDFDHLDGLLFAGDSSSKYWQEKIIPHLTEGAAESKYLLASHHGSYSFFGEDRDEVREADPYPDNYEALDKIQSKELIVSANSKFPTSRDQSGDQPPHYAAYKWYHQWYEDNRNVKNKKVDPHPKSWHYTSDGNICLEKDGKNWKLDNDWSLQKAQSKNAQKLGAAHKVGALSGGLGVPKTRYYASRTF
ncbi:hypothetical protein DMA11_07825 [Marinilabiliaceae bacterium JC017]|nr:hypothetical protein DMA11_07825 [Marinilabiliaceae bacterium JC017]